MIPRIHYIGESAADNYFTVRLHRYRIYSIVGPSHRSKGSIYGPGRLKTCNVGHRRVTDTQEVPANKHFPVTLNGRRINKIIRTSVRRGKGSIQQTVSKQPRQVIASFPIEISERAAHNNLSIRLHGCGHYGIIGSVTIAMT